MNKMIPFFSIMMLLFSSPAQSQTDSSKVKLWTNYPGYIITWEDDTIKGYIRLNNLVDNQEKALYFKNKDDKKWTEKYRPKDIKAYKVGPRFYESIKFHVMGETKGYHFFLRQIRGPITVYEWYREPERRTEERVVLDDEDILNSQIDLSFSESDLTATTYFRKLDGDLENLSALKYLTNFKKNMAKLVSDYPELTQKIAREEEGYTFGNQEKIIREYNDWYLSKQQ
ncbi:MAG: hypothetical protein KQI35_09000 [Bacteroidetes bacterium]|nr:hypothetical protein [Bacteroidota bacterium]